jgi:hypothetical protein
MSSGIAYQIANVDGMTLAEVDAVLAAGGRFVIFEYTLSFGLVTFMRPSKVWLVRDDAEARRVARRYTIPTAIFGWWGLPFGPDRTLHALRANSGGGADVTSDVRGALTEATVANGVVRFEEATDTIHMFDIITGPDLAEIRKWLHPVLERHPFIDAAWAGRLVTEESTQIRRPIAICLDTREPIDESFVEEARTALREGFPRWARFEFIDMAEGEIGAWVIKQCDPIYLRER